MIRKSDKDSTTFFKDIFVDASGTEVAVTKIIHRDTDGTEQEVYPQGAIKLRITSNYDTASKRSVDGDQYGAPTLNPLSETYVPLEVTVTPYPSNSGWKLTSSDFDLGDEEGQVHYGEATIALTVAIPDEVGYTLYSINAVPLRGDLDSETFKFWAVKYSDSALDADYSWDFDSDLIDSVTGLTLVNTNGYAATYKTGYTDKSLAGVYDSTYTTDPNLFSVPLTLPDWKTTGMSVAVAGRFYRGGYCGFYDEVSANDYNGNNFLIKWLYRQPQFVGTNRFSYTSPETTVADRLSYTSTHLLVITLSPAIDVSNAENIVLSPNPTEDETEFTVTYTSPNVDYTKVWSQTVYEKLEDFSFFIMKSYVDGVLQGEGFIRAYATASCPGEGLFAIGFTNATDQRTYPDMIDRASVFAKTLTASEIAGECAVFGISAETGETTVTVAAQDTRNPRTRTAPSDVSAITMTPKLKAFILDNKTIAVAGVFREWILERLYTEYANTDAVVINYRNGYTPEYIYNFVFQFNIWELYKSYQPLMLSRFATESNFLVDGNAVTLEGNWSTSIGQMRFADPYDGTAAVETGLADVAHYAYLTLDTPMELGSTHTVSWMGQELSFSYTDETYCSSIKVNQEGYLPAAGMKYAYLGTWLGTGGRWDPTTNSDLTFDLIDTSTGLSVYSGTAVARNTVESFTLGENTIQVSGENTYVMDFSSVTTEGSYRIKVNNVGYSHEFLISQQAIGKCFWTNMRGLFHHRSGCDQIVAPYTNWPYAQASFMQTYESEFVCDEDQYGRVATLDGTLYSTLIGSHFDMVPALATGNVFRDVHGGWYDAADFDRRPYHLITARDVTEPYLRFPENFSDNQLNIPESGNGIPDILAEAEWGLDVWRRAQHVDGGCACWIETDSHEKEWPWESSKLYYLGSASRQDSLNYAWSAAKLAKALRMVGTDLALYKSALYTESAIRAFNWGVNEDNTLDQTFTQASSTNETYTFYYTEDVSKVNRLIAPAAASLYMLTGETRFSDYITETNFNAYYSWVSTNENTFMLYASSEFMLDLDEQFPAFCSTYQTFIMKQANAWKVRQATHPYYAMSWEPSSAYYNYQSWGVAHPDYRGRVYIYAWLYTGDTAWRDQALLAMDFTVGCNPTGRTMTTGLGKVAPIHHLDSWLPQGEVELGAYSPLPGISPYTFTGGDGYCSGSTGVVPWVYRMTASAYTYLDMAFAGVGINTLPGGYNTTVTNTTGIVSSWLKSRMPSWRHACECEDSYVAGGEFTIWETVGGKCFMFGCLLGGAGFTPDPSWVAQAPVTDRYDSEGLIFLP
jgi:endoglucanase